MLREFEGGTYGFVALHELTFEFGCRMSGKLLLSDRRRFLSLPSFAFRSFSGPFVYFTLASHPVKLLGSSPWQFVRFGGLLLFFDVR
jgi:hypothetical protein